MNDIVNDKNGPNITNDSFAHKLDDLLAMCGADMTNCPHEFIAPCTLLFPLSIGTRHIGRGAALETLAPSRSNSCHFHAFVSKYFAK